MAFLKAELYQEEGGGGRGGETGRGGGRRREKEREREIERERRISSSLANFQTVMTHMFRGHK